MKPYFKFLSVVVFCLFLQNTPLSSNEDIYYGPTGSGAVITCSSGNHGSCFMEYANWCSYYALITLECKWTGYQSTHCSLIMVKLYNICLDYFIWYKLYWILWILMEVNVTELTLDNILFEIWPFSSQRLSHDVYQTGLWRHK